MAIHL